MNNDARLEVLKPWLKTALNTDDFEITVASADASFRRYFRVHYQQKTAIVMDAPPEKESCVEFIAIAKQLTAAGINAPEILAENQQLGFLLLSDLGDTQYLSVLNNDSADQLYKQAIDCLLKMQPVSTEHLPSYDHQLLDTEMSLFTDWFLQKHLNITLSAEQLHGLKTTFDHLSLNALNQPQVFVHRDFHSRNLMQTTTNNPGVLDFQDAVRGPISYDLASLLKDCYINWPRQQIEDWLAYYFNKAQQIGVLDQQQNLASFISFFDLMAVQRHLKAIGIFARLNIRDNKPGYLKDIPRTLQYILDSCDVYPSLMPLKTLLEELAVPEKLVLAEADIL